MSEQIFISYSKKDKEFANRLADDLSKRGFKVWIDRSIGGGERWRESIESNLKDSNDVIIVVSPNSMNSDWVRHEGSLAYGWGKKLYPVLLANVETLPPWLEEYQWVSFTNIPYATALDALCSALSPPNPSQALLDERVNAYLQTGELFGEEFITALEGMRTTIVVSEEAETILHKSKQALESRRQNETGQRHALAEARQEQKITAKRSKFKVNSLIALFFLAILFAILSFSPYATGWQKLRSFDTVKKNDIENAKYFVTMDPNHPERIFISDYTSGGFYKSSLNDKQCWHSIVTLPSQDAIVTYAAVSGSHVYIITSDGMFVSSDQGENWEPLETPVGQEGRSPTAITVNPDNPMQVFAGMTPAGLLVSDNGGKNWKQAAIPLHNGEGIQALAHNGTNLILAIGQAIWNSKDNAQNWTLVLDGVSSIYGLSVVGSEGRYFIALGEQGVGDMDVNSDGLHLLADSPPSSFIQSISASNDARYATDRDGIWYWRLWNWTDFNWLRARLGIPIPCYESE